MAPSVLPPEVVLWIDAQSAAMAGRVVALLGTAVKVIAVGAPSRVPQISSPTRAGSGHYSWADGADARNRDPAALAGEFNCSCADDLRKMLSDHPATFVFLATADGVDDQVILSAAAAGATVLSTEPLAASFDEWARLHPRGGATGPGFFLPAFTSSPGWRSAADPREALPAPHSLSIGSVGPSGEGSLLAHLYDAWQVLLTISNLPETIDASLCDPNLPVSDDPRQAAGSLSAHARLSHRRSATLQISDRAPRHARRLVALGEGGQLTVHNGGYELLGANGEVIDAQPAAAEPPSFAALVAHHWRQFLDQPAAAQRTSPPEREKEVLACCLACLLSCRTGQPESPAQFLDARRHG
jgi:hypothetical protein